MVRYGRVLWHLGVVLLAALVTSLGLRLLQREVSPAWPGWQEVQYAAGGVFVLAVLVYGLLVVRRGSRGRSRKR